MVIDVETTGQSVQKGDRMIEIALVVIEDNQITNQYNQFINPEKSIPSFITQLTSIDNQDVADQPAFHDIVEEIKPLLENAILVAHNAPFDLSFLNGELVRAGEKELTPKILDTVELARILLPQAPGYKLTELAEYLHITHDNPHRAISDALVTADLLFILKNKFQHLPQNVIEQLLTLAPVFRSDWQVLYHEIEQFVIRTDIEEYRGFSLKERPVIHQSERQVEEDYAQFMESCYADLARNIAGYEKRNGQEQISTIIYDHFRTQQHALIEAETGLGKTIGYLIPVLYEALHERQPVVISTNNTNLQSQLLEKDLAKLNITVRTAMIKGKNHYISLENFEQFYHDTSYASYQDRLFKAMILVWLTETTTGDIDELQISVHKHPTLYQIVVHQGKCMPVWEEYCFYQRTLTQAKQASVIITNHALLAIDMLSEHKMIPAYQKLIVDEAHQLAETASDFLGASLNYVELTALFHQLEKHIIADQVKTADQLEYIKYEADSLFRQLFQFVRDTNEVYRTVSDIGRLQAIWSEQAQRKFVDAVRRVSLAFRQLSIRLDQEERQQLNRYDDLLEQLLVQPDPDAITWLEIDQQGAENAVYIHQEPFSVQQELQEYLFQVKETVILISATLTMNKSFHYMRNKLGLTDDRTREYVIDHYFDYKRNVQLFIPNDLPPFQYPNSEPFLYAINEAIISIAEKTKGKMLVLFTSYDMLKKSYDILKEVDELSHYMIIGQGISTGSRNRLIKQFQGFDQSILLGTNAYWQGIDIPGDDLSCLVIVKLPFQSPQDPVFKRKSDYVKSLGLNPFMELSLPQAVLQFKQGFGRLIRKNTDKGSVFVFDDRLITKRYGKTFIDSVPEIPVYYETINQLIERME